MGLGQSLRLLICKSVKNAWLGLVLIATVDGFAIAVTDSTGWTAWSNSSGQIVDSKGDQQTGQTTDDFVGNSTTYAAFQQKAGLLGGADTLMFRMRFDSFNAADRWGNGGNVGVGFDITGDGAMDMIMMYTEGSGNVSGRSRVVSFGTPGAGANNSPSTTTWSFDDPSLNVNLVVDSTYDYVQTTGNVAGDTTPDAWMTIAVSFAAIEAAIQNIVPGYGSYDFNYSSMVSYIGFTSQSPNALNQDMAGADKSGSDSKTTTTFAALGALTPQVDAYGNPKAVPEAGTYLQVGVLLAAGAASLWRRKRRAAADTTSAPRKAEAGREALRGVEG